MEPKLRIGSSIQVGPDWDSYIGKEVTYTVNALEKCTYSPFIKKEDCLGESGLRKVTMEGEEQRIIIVGEKRTNSSWFVLDIFVSSIGRDKPEKPFE